MNGLAPFPDINPVAIGIGKDKSPLAVVFVCQGFDDAYTCVSAVLVKRVDVVNEHVHDIHVCRRVRFVLAEMDFCRVFFQDHETDRVAVFEGFLKAEYLGVEGAGCLDVAYGKAGRGTAVGDGVDAGLVHRMIPTNGGRGGGARAGSGAVSVALS